MKLEDYIQDEYEIAPHALRPLLLLLKAMIDEAWENGNADGYDGCRHDAIMIANRETTKKAIRKSLELDL